MEWVVAWWVATSLATACPPAGAEPPETLHARVRAALLDGDSAGARAALAELERDHPVFFAANGHDYLAAHLARSGGDPAEALRRFERVASSGSPLAGRAAFRAAELLAATRPAEAARRLAAFRSAHPGSPLAGEAGALGAVLSIERGRRTEGRRLLAALPRAARRGARRRLLASARAAGRAAEATRWARELLAEDTGDAAAVEAADWLLGAGTADEPVAVRRAVAEALLVGRRFAPALAELEAVAAGAPTAAARDEARYQLGRAAMRAGDEERARAAFERLAGGRGVRADRARYQLGRLDLACGDEVAATERFRALAGQGQDREVAGEALLKLARLAGAGGDVAAAEAAAREAVRRWGRHSDTAAAVAIEAAGAALDAANQDKAVEYLGWVAPGDAARAREVAYWRGVALAGLGRQDEAAAALLAARAGHDLVAALAARRLLDLDPGALPDPTADLEGARAALERGESEAARRAARRALERAVREPEVEQARRLLAEALGRSPAVRAALALELPPERAAFSRPPSFRRGALAAAEDLRFLGLDGEAAEELEAAAGPAGPERLLLAAELWARAGNLDRSLRAAERLVRRLPAELRGAGLPQRLHRLLYPQPWSDLVERHAAAHGVDPDLVRAVMREESRFDPQALSGAGARGLMQFIPETARRVGERIGLSAVRAEDIHRPDVAIRLGAAYLAELLDLFDGREAAAIAAYNAGEETAWGWLGRTRGRRADELMREIEYGETRAYLDRVLTTLAAYRSGREAAATRAARLR